MTRLEAVGWTLALLALGCGSSISNVTSGGSPGSATGSTGTASGSSSGTGSSGTHSASGTSGTHGTTGTSAVSSGGTGTTTGTTTGAGASTGGGGSTGRHHGSSSGANGGTSAASSTTSAATTTGGAPGTTGGGASTGSGPTGGNTGTTAGATGAGTSAGGTRAVWTNDFLDSLGACTHITQGIDNGAQDATAMSYIGLREFRDDGSASSLSEWTTLHQNSGARGSILPLDGDVAGTISMDESLAAVGGLLAVEGPNEPNNFPVTYNGQTSSYTGSFMPVAQFQSALYAAVQADSNLAGIPVFSSSEAGGSEPDDVGLQFLTIPTGAGATMPDGTQYADFANNHNYVCGSSGALVDNVAWWAEYPLNVTGVSGNGWDGLYGEFGVTWHGAFNGYSDSQLPGLPKVTTETGWVTQGSGAITEDQQGRVFLDLYLSAYRQGWSYTFVYMLRDDPNQGYWGFVDTSYNPKTSGTYMHNLTTVLADTSSPGTPDSLGYSIAGEPSTTHDMLMEKRDGTFELAVWAERFGSGGSDSVTVDLGGTYPTVNVYDPTTGTAPVQTLSNVSSVLLSLSDHPNIIEIPPGG